MPEEWAMTVLETASLFFWLLTSLNVVISMRFVRGIRRLHAIAPSPDNLVVAVGHRKDLWLLAAAIWTAALLKDWSHIVYFFFAALPVQFWLMQRTLARLRMLSFQD
jgi:hypothetical protein